MCVYKSDKDSYANLDSQIKHTCGSYKVWNKLQGTFSFQYQTIAFRKLQVVFVPILKSPWILYNFWVCVTINIKHGFGFFSNGALDSTKIISHFISFTRKWDTCPVNQVNHFSRKFYTHTNSRHMGHCRMSNLENI